jgi:hypothetical protein
MHVTYKILMIISFVIHFKSIILLYWMLISLIGMLCSSYSMYWVQTGYMRFMAHPFAQKQIDGPPKLMEIISWPILISSCPP